MAYYLKLYFATLAVFFAVDMFWLGVVSRTFYRKHLGFLMAPEVNWYAALTFYFLFVLGVLVFVILPALTENAFPVMLVMELALAATGKRASCDEERTVLAGNRDDFVMMVRAGHANNSVGL